MSEAEKKQNVEGAILESINQLDNLINDSMQYLDFDFVVDFKIKLDDLRKLKNVHNNNLLNNK